MFQTENLEELNDLLIRLGHKFSSADLKILKPKIYDALFEGANNIRNTILRNTRNTPKAPWWYPRQQGRKRHYPSLPGESPAIDAGNMIESILYDVDDYQMEVGSRIQEIKKGNVTYSDYPKNLEDGTSKMEARPWLEPAVDANIDKIVDDFERIGPEFASEVFKELRR